MVSAENSILKWSNQNANGTRSRSAEPMFRTYNIIIGGGVTAKLANTSIDLFRVRFVGLYWGRRSISTNAFYSRLTQLITTMCVVAQFVARRTLSAHTNPVWLSRYFCFKPKYNQRRAALFARLRPSLDGLWHYILLKGRCTKISRRLLTKYWTAARMNSILQTKFLRPWHYICLRPTRPGRPPTAMPSRASNLVRL